MKKGTMKTAVHAVIISSGDRPNADARVAPISRTIAFLKTLSLNAEKKSVVKKAEKRGAKSTLLREAGWFTGGMLSPGARRPGSIKPSGHRNGGRKKRALRW